MARINLTDRRIAALRGDAAGKLRLELRDAIVPGLIVRVAKRRKVFALHARFPGSKHPTRRVIGTINTLSIEQARATARDWINQLGKGIDPAVEARRRAEEQRRTRAAEQLQQEDLFRNVAEDYLRRKVAGQRRARAAERTIRNELMSVWGDKAIGSISRRDVVRLVEAIDDRGAPVYGTLVFAHARALFRWAINRGSYHLEHSPCDHVRVGDLVSRRKQARQRTLADDELLCFWKATKRLPYPWRQMFLLLALTGVRRSEAAGARWSEIDRGRALWTVPPARFKSNVSHLVPLTAQMLTIIDSLPRFKSGDHLFSFTAGKTPALVLHFAKQKLDRLMLRYLKALATLRGSKDPAGGTLPPWVVHDLRRTCRTKMAALRVQDHVAELALGHSRRGVAGVYDRHHYLPEIRHALELWATELQRIVSPPRTDTDNVVVPLRGQGA